MLAYLFISFKILHQEADSKLLMYVEKILEAVLGRVDSYRKWVTVAAK